LTVNDPDAGQTLSFALTGGTGYCGASPTHPFTGISFVPPSVPTAAGNESTLLQFNVGANDAGTHCLRVQVSEGSNTTTQDLSITVTAQNSSPAFVTTGGSVNEPIGTEVDPIQRSLTLTVNDPDNGQTLTFSVVGGTGFCGASPTHPFTGILFDPPSLPTVAGNESTLLKLNVGPNDAGSHCLRVQVGDGSASATQDLSITVVAQNSTPEVTAPVADFSVPQDSPDTVIDLAPVFDDPDAADALTFLVTGNTNPGLVSTSVAGDDLTLDYGAGQSGNATITVRATDGGGAFVEDAFVVTVVPAAGGLLSIGDVSVVEGNSGSVNATFTITLSTLNPSVTVSYATSNGNATAPSDYMTTSGTATFSGCSVAPCTFQFNVPVAGDGSDEPNEAFLVTLSNPVNATLSKAVGQGTILDDDGRPALCKPIAHVPFTIDTEDSFCLVANLAHDAGDGAAITIDADNVLLDFKGFALDGTGAGSGTLAYGVYAFNRSDVTIRGGSILGFHTGVFLDDNSPGATNSSGHVVREMRLGENQVVGIRVAGRGTLIRNNLVLDTGGTTTLGPNANAYGILLKGAGARLLSNDVIQTLAQGTGIGFGVELQLADGAVVERNRIGNAALSAASSKGIVVNVGNDVLMVQNRLHKLHSGLVFSGTGKYRGNLTLGVTTPFSGGTNAGNNQ
jgi:hypothetical protein